MKLDYKDMLENIYMMVKGDRVGDLVNKLGTANKYSQEEARELARIVGAVYEISHCLTCNACAKEWEVEEYTQEQVFIDNVRYLVMKFFEEDIGRLDDRAGSDDYDDPQTFVERETWLWKDEDFMKVFTENLDIISKDEEYKDLILDK